MDETFSTPGWVKVNEFKKLIIVNKDKFLLDAEEQVFHLVS
jgi:hypothetical protein